MSWRRGRPGEWDTAGRSLDIVCGRGIVRQRWRVVSNNRRTLAALRRFYRRTAELQSVIVVKVILVEVHGLMKGVQTAASRRWFSHFEFPLRPCVRRDFGDVKARRIRDQWLQRLLGMMPKSVRKHGWSAAHQYSNHKPGGIGRGPSLLGSPLKSRILAKKVAFQSRSASKVARDKENAQTHHPGIHDQHQRKIQIALTDSNTTASNFLMAGRRERLWRS